MKEEKYNTETLAAFKETEDIASGKIKPKTYNNLSAAIKDLENKKPNKKTIAAMQEAEDIASRKIKSKGYNSVDEMIEDIIKEYSYQDAQPSFFRTRIPVKLMEHEGEALLSRSQAKHLINRLGRFLEVILDFEGVKEIGQAFADEIFRVFHNDYPDVHLIPVNCSSNVKRMIAHVSVEYCQDVYNKDIKL